MKNKVYKYMTSVSKNVYIDKLDKMVNKNNNRYYRTTEMKPADVKPSIYVNAAKEINNNDPKLKIGDIVKRSKYY